MAQSVRRPETLIVKDRESQSNKSRTSYFGNVKTRLGSKLPPDASQPPHFANQPWETQPQARGAPEPTARSRDQKQAVVGRPLNHIPHIRNPKLRQYYLQGTSLDVSSAAVKPERMGGASYDSTSTREPLINSIQGSGCQSSPRSTMGKQSLFQSLYSKYSRRNVYSDIYSKGLPEDTVFSVTSQFSSAGASSAEEGKMGFFKSCSSSGLSSPCDDIIPREDPLVSKGKNTSSIRGSSQQEQDSDCYPKGAVEQDPASLDTHSAQSPSPEAEYDKLLDVEAVPMPDGQLCLLALPPECCQGGGPEAVQYLKLFCRYITDRKGVVSGILLVTSNKIFFDPCKTHPLVQEHGCEEYLLSCSVDNLSSVCFYSDISHIHFNTPQQRKKGTKIFQKLKKRLGGSPNQKGESTPALKSAAHSEFSSMVLGLEEEAGSRDMAEAEKELDAQSEVSVGVLGVAVLSSAATFCCGGQEVVNKPRPVEAKKSETLVAPRSLEASSSSLMFVRLRVQPPAGKKKGAEGLQLGSVKHSPRREAWLALTKDSSDELYAYLTRCRPDLCILEGGAEEGEADRDEEEFVLIEDKEEEEEEEDEEEEGELCHRLRSAGEDWEMVLMEDSRTKPTLLFDRDPEGLCNIVDKSDILEASHIRELSKELPPRTVGHTWQLAYSTSHHGSSLKSLYRKLSATDSPVLIVIKDALDEVFGAFLSHPLRPSETFYGTGETFLFMAHPRFKCFRWTGENSFFIKGDLDSFAIGGGSGHFGLWVDENLYFGRSSPCYTFNNCCLSETDDFRVMELEAWTFS